MKERKYKEDWVNETRFDERGREKRYPVYRGPWFHGLSGRERRSALLWASLPWLVFVLAILLYFRLNYPGATVLYVFLPAAIGLFPGLYWAMGILRLARLPEKTTRLQKENSAGRILRSAAGCAICALAALVGDTVFLISGGKAAAEGPGTMMLLAAAAAACAAVNRFRRINRETTEERGNDQ